MTCREVKWMNMNYQNGLQEISWILNWGKLWWGTCFMNLTNDCMIILSVHISYFFIIFFQVKPARAGSSIGVKVAYGLDDSLEKANAIISEVLVNFYTILWWWFSKLLLHILGWFGFRGRILIKKKKCASKHLYKKAIILSIFWSFYIW